MSRQNLEAYVFQIESTVVINYLIREVVYTRDCTKFRGFNEYGVDTLMLLKDFGNFQIVYDRSWNATITAIGDGPPHLLLVASDLEDIEDPRGIIKNYLAGIKYQPRGPLLGRRAPKSLEPEILFSETLTYLGVFAPHDPSRCVEIFLGEIPSSEIAPYDPSKPVEALQEKALKKGSQERMYRLDPESLFILDKSVALVHL